MSCHVIRRLSIYCTPCRIDGVHFLPFLAATFFFGAAFLAAFLATFLGAAFLTAFFGEALLAAFAFANYRNKVLVVIKIESCKFPSTSQSWRGKHGKSLWLNLKMLVAGHCSVTHIVVQMVTIFEWFYEIATYPLDYFELDYNLSISGSWIIGGKFK